MSSCVIVYFSLYYVTEYSTNLMTLLILLFSGYHTDRGWIVAWEALVMCRKLIVTIIAVGIAEDPYIQVCYSLFSTESMTEYSCNLMILCPPA